MLDSNTYYLNEHLYNLDKLQSNWDMSKDIKRGEVVELASKILLQTVDQHTFEIAFAEHYMNISEDKFEWLISSLEDIEEGICDPKLKRAFIIEALEAACWCLHGVELEEIYEDFEQFDGMITEVDLEL